MISHLFGTAPKPVTLSLLCLQTSWCLCLQFMNGAVQCNIWEGIYYLFVICKFCVDLIM